MACRAEKHLLLMLAVSRFSETKTKNSDTYRSGMPQLNKEGQISSQQTMYQVEHATAPVIYLFFYLYARINRTTTAAVDGFAADHA
jgi:hypothetical protein